MADRSLMGSHESHSAAFSDAGPIALAPPEAEDETVAGTASTEVVPRARVASFKAEWRESYGASWWLDIACFGAVIFLLGALQPLRDPDLPMHLATGEWIVRHGAVPFVEPFAWTRAGAPYYAYSWSVEIIYYLTMRWWGALGLHLLDGATLVSAAAAMLVLGHAARWKPWVTFCMAAINVGTAMTVVASLRPQLVLFSLVPLAWAFTYRILAAPRIRWVVLGLVVTSAAAANAHLFFVLTAAPIALLVANPPSERRRGWAVCSAIVAGWLLSPYALAWPDVFGLNFGYNALLVQPSPILEFHAGFRPGFWLLLALPLSLIPWAVPRERFSRRERMVHCALWLVGLAAFGYAGRLLLCWWLIILPAAAAAIEHIGGGGRAGVPRRLVKVVTYTVAVASLTAIAVMVVPVWRTEGNATTRRLPSAASSSIEPLLDWLDCNVRAGADGRIYTWFNYGSYLTWRLPGYSASIDGRTIFPDSVAKPEALTSGLLAHPEYRVWPAADLAIVPRYFGVAATLDTAKGWKLAATLRRPEHPADSVGLWVKRSWWQRVGSAPLGERAAAVPIPSSAAGVSACAGSAAPPLRSESRLSEL